MNTEAVFLVVCDPSVNEQWTTIFELMNELGKVWIMEFLARSDP